MANDSIAVRVLLVSGNIRTVNFLSEQMRQLSILVHTCSDTDTATKRMCRAKFEGVIVDLELGDQGLQFLGMLRELTSHRHAISYAIVKSSDEATAAFRGHTNFVLHRPFVTSSILRTFRAAYPLMFRERRRGYRHAIECRVLVKQERAVEFWANSVNISETGLAITTTTPFGVGDRVRLELDIPAFSELIHVSGEVCWSRNGRAGIRFVNVPAPVSERFQFWISERMSELVGA
jgi:response regulator RpfG family c-di-GMP phosphodiesterase